MILFPDKEIDAQSINLLVQSHTTGSGRAEIRIWGLLSLCGSRAPEGLWLRKFLKKILGRAAGKSLGVILRNAYSWIPAKSYGLDSWEVGPRICISISSLGTCYSQVSQRTANLTLEVRLFLKDTPGTFIIHHLNIFYEQATALSSSSYIFYLTDTDTVFTTC